MAEHTATKSEAPVGGTGAGQEIYLGLLWLGTSMYAARVELTGTDLSGVLGAAAGALPGVVAAAMVTAAGIAVAVGSRLRGAGTRLLGGLGVGAGFGVVVAAGIRFAYGPATAIVVLAAVAGAASMLGGAVAILPGAVLEATLWATTWVFFAGVIFGVLQPNVVKLLGGGPTADPAAQAAADSRFVLGASLLTGLIAGVYALRTLRSEHHARGWYLVAGALPGLFLLAAEGLNRVGGSARVGRLAGLSEGDEQALAGLRDPAALRHALIVLAVGALVAAVGIGRNRPEPEESGDESTEDSTEDSRRGLTR